MMDVETIFDSDREEYEFMQEKKQPMSKISNIGCFVVERCILCDKTISTSEYPHAMKFVCCDDCKALWKKIKKGATDERN